MSGCSYDTSCPNCNSLVNAYSDYKPFDIISIGPCMNCGFQAYTKVEYLNLKELNEAREEYNTLYSLENEDRLEPLEELPAQEDL